MLVATALLAVRLSTSKQDDVALLPTAGPGALRAVPAFSHVFVIVLENKGYDQIVGSADAPYLNGLIGKYGLATGYVGLSRPSQPNYLALVSGSTQGVDDDRVHTVDAPNLFDQLEAAGRDWRETEENIPAGCYTDATATGGPDGAGDYARKHNPAISFKSIQTAPQRCAKIQPLSAFDPGAADFQLIVPNLCHDMHDCSVAEGDKWLSSWVPRLLDSSAWKDGGVLFVTFDEPSDKGNDTRIATIVVSRDVTPGFTSATPHTHYSLLRTIQEAWRLPCLAASCANDTLGEFFGAAP